MLGIISGQLRSRRSRAAALGAGILVAAVSFVLLSSASRTGELHVRGSVRSNFRTSYDILVRPSGARTPIERSEELVRDNYLSGSFGGITFRQYDTIKRLRGIIVAAPIANVGYTLLNGTIPIRLSHVLTAAPHQLFRVRFTWRATNGLSRYSTVSRYVYYAPRDPFVLTNVANISGAMAEVAPGHSEPLPVCAPFNSSLSFGHSFGPFDYRHLTGLDCFSRKSPAVSRVVTDALGLPEGAVGTATAVTFPIFVAAIDPVQEARLLRLDRTIVSGRYLRASDKPVILDNGLGGRYRFVPVLSSTKSYLDDAVEVRVEQLKAAPGTDVPAELASSRAYRFVTGLEGKVVERRRIEAASLYGGLGAGTLRGVGFAGIGVQAFWTTSQVRYQGAGYERLVPVPVENSQEIWKSPLSPTGYAQAPPDNADIQFRRLKAHPVSNLITDGVPDGALLRVVGRFDPERLRGFSPLSRVPLETYYPPVLEAADAESRRLLGGHAYLPTQNLGDYVAQPPLLLTTLQGLRALLNRRWYAGVSQKAPISVIRVRVAGVKGPDALSRERIRIVAQQIHDKTGLQVDITAGSSPHPLLISLPRGKFGRPPLLLREGWSKKGVSVLFLNAVDRKSLAIFALVLVVCSLFLANGALAAVRARRAEIGTLLTFGWTRAAIFRLLLGELALIGLIAGLLGTGLAALLVFAFSFQLSLWRTLLVLPIALLLACLAGLLPAWRAAQGLPLDAIRPRVAGRAHRRRVRRLFVLALANLRRLPARTLVGAAGLAVGVAALTVLLGIERAFQGTLVGTLLGNAISLQVRGVDLVAVALTIGLAAFSVADVLYLNLRERAAELVTLRTVGWADTQLARLVALEALGLGLIGSLAGAALGLALGGLLLQVPLAPLALASLLAALGGTLVALAASLLPLSQIRRLTPPAVLAAE